MTKSCPVCGATYPDSSAFCPVDGTTLIVENSGGDLVGSVVADRYRVEKLLGEGGMGRVYLAQHVRLPQQAAIKVLHPGMISDPEAVARFNREAANAARIEHERVARVFDFGETRDGSVYLAMEYVPGRSLHGLITEAGRLSPERAANITYQVADGLEAAHAIGIVHRDLKPDNIMVITDANGVDRCKVVDFGIAKATRGGSTTRLTRTGTVVGTPEFMSPEQFMGEELDARSDVYALALVAYNTFTGTLPFVSTTPERAMAARMIDDPRPLSSAVPEVSWPAELQQAFDRALDRDPANRTASAMEFAEAVVAATEQWKGGPVLRGRTPLSSRRITPPSAEVIPVATAVAAEPTQTDASSPSRPPRGVPRVAIVGVAAAVLGFAGWLGFMRDVSPSATPVPEASVDSGISGSGAPTATERKTDVPAAPNAPQASLRTGAGATPGLSPVPSAPPPATVVADTPAETPPSARRTLDSVNAVLEDAQSGEAEAQAAVRVLERLLPQMATATDSTWTYLALVSAHGQAGVAHTRACSALRNAAKRATSPAQLTAIANFYGSPALACVP